MATTEPVYNQTTTVQEPISKKWLVVPSENLGKIGFGIKIVEVLLSFVAFVLEEVVSNCSSCGPLYFFEFVSCTAFFFTLLLLILLATTLHKRVGINCWPSVDFGYTVAMAFLFFIASVVFVADNGGTSLESAAVIFGFLATLAFVFDFIFFWKMKGIPCQGGSNQPTAENATRSVPETEKLNANGTEESH
ncbi:CKLF-like MARVEL transmembrane domain-containing protein 6 [Xyrauchen texanus]|uniref:CKLF-like MARVEL transmembrane domain-containing protein 6 n=1 Tax=Xyrauchen texanus TaxID=154827 RepID=UPI0022420846|nr:CKLF-like MARVEL transmembrane domain-containing protein 6 [Xyrauchen texanus]XP_051999272.1 CKLF-like MARVEL transmembrane domain-containing protein 6 [Xyrauchen texanus]